MGVSRCECAAPADLRAWQHARGCPVFLERHGDAAQRIRDAVAVLTIYADVEQFEVAQALADLRALADRLEK